MRELSAIRWVLSFPVANDLLTEKIIGVFYEVYNELVFGFLESVYRDAGLRLTLRRMGESFLS